MRRTPSGPAILAAVVLIATLTGNLFARADAHGYESAKQTLIKLGSFQPMFRGFTQKWIYLTMDERCIINIHSEILQPFRDDKEVYFNFYRINQIDPKSIRVKHGIGLGFTLRSDSGATYEGEIYLEGYDDGGEAALPALKRLLEECGTKQE